MDYSKLSQRDIELKAIHNKVDETRIKRAGFEHRMDRVNKAIKNAKTENDRNRFEKIKKDTLRLYNKYSGRI